MAIWRTHGFLVTLSGILVVGFFWPEVYAPLGRAKWLRDALVAVVLFITALPHDFASVRRVLRDWTAAIAATAINVVALPLLSVPVGVLLPQEFRTGLIVAASVPSTLASAAVLTRRAGGNDLICVVVTIVTTLGCFLVAPVWIRSLAGHAVEISFADMARKLFVLVLIPVVVGQSARGSRRVADWASGHARQLSLIAQTGILLMIAIGSWECGERLQGSDSAALRPLPLIGLVGACLVLHGLGFGLGWLAGRWAALPRADWIAVGFSGSQKTLLVGLHLALSVGGGPVILPMVLYHVLQLVVDTILADWLKSAANHAEPRDSRPPS